MRLGWLWPRKEIERRRAEESVRSIPWHTLSEDTAYKQGGRRHFAARSAEAEGRAAVRSPRPPSPSVGMSKVRSALARNAKEGEKLGADG